MKKRIMVVLLSTAMVASLAIGCGSNSKSDDTKSETKTEEKTDTKEETKDVESVEQRTVYVTPEWLKSAQDGNQEGYEDVVVAEVAYGDNAKDCDSYQKGHIPGAIYVGDVEVEDATGSEEGAYNLLSADEIEKNLLSHGITKDTKIVLYGGDISGTARVAYAYIWAGVEAKMSGLVRQVVTTIWTKPASRTVLYGEKVLRRQPMLQTLQMMMEQ